MLYYFCCIERTIYVVLKKVWHYLIFVDHFWRVFEVPPIENKMKKKQLPCGQGPQAWHRPAAAAGPRQSTTLGEHTHGPGGGTDGDGGPWRRHMA